jgi:agmatinase
MMEIFEKQFLGPDGAAPSLEDASVIVAPFGYEGGISYGKGTAKGPDAIIDASHYLELYDEVLDVEPSSAGIYTIKPLVFDAGPEQMFQTVYDTAKTYLAKDKFIVSIGGDHSISSAYCKALQEKYGAVSVIQFDAHADLRDSYEGSRLSHASVMSRIREITASTLQIGIRSLTLEEARRIRAEKISVCTMENFRNDTFDLKTALKSLPGPVFITFDVDVFDWSVIRSTGTPEPGGLLWDEAIHLLKKIFSQKDVVGFDVVELAQNESDPNSAFAAAKLIYKMIGFKYFL